MMILENIKPFLGQHCETTATGTLLTQLGIELSEPMLFGLGEGLGFLFWKMKTMPFPFLGGRVKTDLLTENICRNLNLKLNVSETSSVAKAWRNINADLQAGRAVGLKLDCYHLEYFTNKIHFAGHYVALYGLDDSTAYLVDTAQQGGQVHTSLESLALARNEKGPMSSKNRSYTIERPAELTDIKQVIRGAIQRNAVDYLNPPIKNVGYLGILKTSTAVVKWFKKSPDVKSDFQTMSMLMERAGTGGALFRNLYRDFLKESGELLHSTKIMQAHQDFCGIAKQWTEVSELFFEAGETADIKYINQAAEILVDLSGKEKLAMERLKMITT